MEDLLLNSYSAQPCSHVWPVVLIVIGVLATGLFIFLIMRTQHNPDLFLSDLVNGLTAVGLSIGLSVILWRAGLTQHRQNRMITHQKIALEESYKKLNENSHELERLIAAWV